MNGASHLRLVPPPRPRGVCIQVVIPLDEETRLVRLATKREDTGEPGGGLWRLQRLEPFHPGSSQRQWRTLAEGERGGVVPPEVRLANKHFVEQLRHAADELDAAGVVAGGGSKA